MASHFVASASSFSANTFLTSEYRAKVWQCPISSLFEDVTEKDVIYALDTFGPQSPIAFQRSESGTENPAWASSTSRLLSPGGAAQSGPPISLSPGDAQHEQHEVAQFFRDTDDQTRHGRVKCKPCIFWYHDVCHQGEDCDFCHLQHEHKDYKAANVSRTTRHKLRARRKQKEMQAKIQDSANSVLHVFRL